jgi:hypothetical protein
MKERFEHRRPFFFGDENKNTKNNLCSAAARKVGNRLQAGNSG